MRHSDDLIKVAELKSRIGDSRYRIVDCRFNLQVPAQGHEEFLKGHIPGAVFADLDRDLAGEISASSGRHPLPDQTEFSRQLEAWGIGNDTPVVAYDDGSGALAARLWWLLHWLGHRQVAVLDGGMAAWRNAGLPVATEVSDYAPLEMTFVPEADSSMIATTAEILDFVRGETDLALVDARDEARFRGDREPIDPVAGHVPGALNFPFSRNLGGDGAWRSAAALREIWRQVLADSARRPLVMMCGSGVTACHLVLSARLAGLPKSRLYVGSWSEWIRDPERPVAGPN